MSFKPMFAFQNGETCGNAQAFETREEATASATARFARWTMPISCFVSDSDEPVNYRWDDVDGDVCLDHKTEGETL